MSKKLLVQKFGGTSLAGLDGFEASAAVIGRYTDEYQVIVVLSAVKGVTDLLLLAIDTAVEGDSGAEPLEVAIARERSIVEELAGQGVQTPLGKAFLEEQHATLTRRVEGIRLLGQCPDETRARILASGEGFSSRLMVDVLNHKGYSAQWSDTDVLPLANEDWLDSLVDTEAAAPLLKARRGFTVGTATETSSCSDAMEPIIRLPLSLLPSARAFAKSGKTWTVSLLPTHASLQTPAASTRSVTTKPWS